MFEGWALSLPEIFIPTILSMSTFLYLYPTHVQYQIRVDAGDSFLSSDWLMDL